MTVACGQKKSKTGSSMRSCANPSERQVLSKGSSVYRLQGPGGPGCCPFPVPGLTLSIFLTGSPSVKTIGSSCPYLHRSVGCHGDGSQFYRNTCSCQCCFYIFADRGSRGIRQCLEGNRTRLELFSMEFWGYMVPSYLSSPTLAPLAAWGTTLTLTAHIQCIAAHFSPPPTAIPKPGSPLSLVWRRATASCVSMPLPVLLPSHPLHSLQGVLTKGHL